MANVLSRLNKPQVLHPPSSDEQLERALDKAGDSRDLAKDVLRSLPDADCTDADSTARHEIPPRFIIENHVHQDSKPDSDPPAKKQIKSALVALGSGIGLVLITVAAAALQKCGH